jgi:hypothetical protein
LIEALSREGNPRAAAISALGKLGRHPEAVRALAAALSAESDCDERVRLVKALAEAQKSAPDARAALVAERDRGDAEAACKKSGLARALADALDEPR